MGKKRPVGPCHICGVIGPLSFEHIPPRAAFNDRPVIPVSFPETLNLGPDDKPQGKAQQKGMGAFTLCDRCNNNTGSWYGQQFVNWCYQGFEILSRTNGKPSLFHLNYVFPLSVLKQVVTMFFSVNSDTFASVHPELVRFILNRERKYLSPKYGFYVYYNTEGKLRAFGVSGRVNIHSGKAVVFSEITFPPFGYVMTIDSDPPDNRLVDITYFSRFDYNEFRILSLKLPALPTYVAVPGDYREKDQIYREAGVLPPPESLT